VAGCDGYRTSVRGDACRLGKAGGEVGGNGFGGMTRCLGKWISPGARTGAAAWMAGGRPGGTHDNSPGREPRDRGANEDVVPEGRANHPDGRIVFEDVWRLGLMRNLRISVVPPGLGGSIGG
jgi:hypothetical protein